MGEKLVKSGILFKLCEGEEDVVEVPLLLTNFLGRGTGLLSGGGESPVDGEADVENLDIFGF